MISTRARSRLAMIVPAAKGTIRMLVHAATYDDARARFQWQVPRAYNIGVDADFTFKDIKLASNRLANALAAHRIRRGDRLAILLQQAPETAIAHIAAYKAGLIAVPLFVLFGEDALEYRLKNSSAAALVTDTANLPKIAAIRRRLPDLKLILVVGGKGEDATLGFAAAVADASDSYSPVPTLADDPALIIFTSGTTGAPKGALHAHRVLLGHLPGVEFPQDFLPQPGDLYWTPADWAWIGGLLDVLLPSLHHGIPVLAHRFRKFDPD